MSHKLLLTNRLPDKTSKLVLTKRLPDKTSKAVLKKYLPYKTSADSGVVHRLLYSKAKAMQIDVEYQIYKYRRNKPIIVTGQLVSAGKRLGELTKFVHLSLKM